MLQSKQHHLSKNTKSSIILCLFIISLLIVIQSVEAHEFKIARFKVSNVDNRFQVMVQLDQTNLIESINQECEEFNLNDYTQFSLLANSYIHETFKLVVDGQKTEYSLDCLEMENGFVYLSGELITSATDFDQMEVYNTCMIHTIDGHSNLITINAKGKLRSFRLDEDRTKTIISY